MLVFAVSSCTTEKFANDGQRWEHILNNISQVKTGMAKKEIVKILGQPDGSEFCPPDVIQYTVDSEYRPEGEKGKYIIMLFNQEDKLIKLKRTDYMYGPKSGKRD